jgi:hypothetical protein
MSESKRAPKHPYTELQTAPEAWGSSFSGLHPQLIPNKRACRFRQALLFNSKVVLSRLLLRFNDQEGTASVLTTNAQQDFLFVGLLHRRVEFIDVGDRLFGH